MSILIIHLKKGQLNIKWDRDTLFSEREGLTPSFRFGPIRFVWRRYRFIPGMR